MARSSTSYGKKWKAGETTVIRVPKRFANRLVALARAWDIPTTKLADSSFEDRARALLALNETEEVIDAIREPLGISGPGTTLYFRDLDWTSDREIRVMADGKGGAKLLVTKGPFGTDPIIEDERSFATEAEGCEAADSYRAVGRAEALACA